MFGQPSLGAGSGRAAVLDGVTDWRARPVGRCPKTPEQLASWVDGALDRAEQVMFAVTPRQELDALAQWQLAQDRAWAGQVRLVVAMTARMSRLERELAGHEVALALGVSSVTGEALVHEHGQIAALPGLLDAVEVGRLSQRHVKAFLRVLDEVSLTLEQRQAVALVAVATYAGQTPGEWAAVIRRLVLTVDPAASARRREERTAQRRVEFYPQPDEQGAMWLTAPVEQVAAAQARIRAEADRLKATGDPRTVEQLLCDVTLQLLTTGVLDGQAPARYEVTVLTPLSVLHGDDLETGEIPGWGPVSAATTRELVHRARSFTQATVDSDGRVLAVNDPVRAERVQRTSVRRAQPADRDAHLPAPDRYLVAVVTAMKQPPILRDLSRSGYRPSTRLLRLLQARDRTCVFPGCHVPAPRTDADHREPWPHGPTSPDNLQCLCRRHHRAKHTLFTTLLDPDGTTIWITRGGWAFRRPPPL